MGRRKNIVGGTIVALAAGYVAGILTAPTSGKQARKKLKKVANNSISELEKQLKALYLQTQELKDKVLNQNPKLSKQVKQAMLSAESSQQKLKQLLSALHGNDSTDEDFAAALKDAKNSLKHLSRYVRK